MNDLESLKSELLKVHAACARWREAAQRAVAAAEEACERSACNLALAQVTVTKAQALAEELAATKAALEAAESEVTRLKWDLSGMTKSRNASEDAKIALQAELDRARPVLEAAKAYYHNERPAWALTGELKSAAAAYGRAVAEASE